MIEHAELRSVPDLFATARAETETEILGCVQPWGYCLEPKFHPRGIGFSGLLVAIRPRPTEAHYDPESVQLRLRDANGSAQWVSLSQRPSFRQPARVCAGHITLGDRREKKVEFFTFGGEIRAVLDDATTVYAIRSPVPILGITPPSLNTVAEKLALKAETALARGDACWGRNRQGFLQRLGEVDPMALYAAILEGILCREDMPPVLCARNQTLEQAARREQAWLQGTGQWSAEVPSLAALLCP